MNSKCMVLIAILYGLGASKCIFAAATSNQEEGQPLKEDSSDWQDLLAFTQEELISSHKGGIGLSLGANYPWQHLGISAFLPGFDRQHWNASLGGGTFSLSAKSSGKTVNIETISRNLLFGSQHYVSNLVPIFYEPIVGLSFWEGEIRPQGTDTAGDDTSSSLISDFSLRGLTFGLKTGVQWWFQDNLLLELAIFQISYSLLIQESYTNNTEDVRQSVREQLKGPITWNGVNIKLSYRFP